MRKSQRGFRVRFAAFAAVALLPMGCGAFGETQPASTVAATASPRAEVVLKVGIVPSQNAVALVEKLGPLFNYLEERISRDLGQRIGVNPELATDYAEFIQRMEEKSYDVAFLGPFSYVEGHDKSGYSAIVRPVRRGDTTYRSMIIVKRGSGIRTLADLRGRTFAFSDEKSTSGYLFPRGYLLENGIDSTRDLKVFFRGGHDNVVLNVLDGTDAAGACYKDAREAALRARPAEIENLVILAETPEIPNEPVAVSSRLLAERRDLVDALTRAMTTLAQDPDHGPRVLASIGEGVEGYATVEDADYDVVRRYAEKLGSAVRGH